MLALGTTLGVIVQCLILFPYLKKAGINLKPQWGLDDRLKQYGGSSYDDMNGNPVTVKRGTTRGAYTAAGSLSPQ